MSKKITLKQMETELHEWGGVYVDRVMRGNDKANRYEVNDPDGKRVAIGFERREVLETAYAEMQSRNAQAPTETPASEAPAAPQVETRFIVGKRSNEYCWYVWDNEDNEEASGNYWSVDEAQARANELNANGPSRVVVDEKDERIAELEAELQKANRVAAAFDAELSKEQQKRIKLEADSATYERIVIQAGKDFEALKDENARMKEAIMKVLRNIRLDEQDALDDLAAIFTIVNGKDTTPTPPAQEAPKFTVGQVVKINSIDYAHDGVIKNIGKEDGEWLYYIETEDGEMPFNDIELEALS